MLVNQTFIKKVWTEGSNYTFTVHEPDIENLIIGDYVVLTTGIGADNNCRVYGRVMDKPAINKLTVLVEKTEMV